MAAFGERSDNPVGINVTAMVDVLLCLCLFYMGILVLRGPQGKIETWLPKDGHSCHFPLGGILEEIRVFIAVDPSTGHLLRKVGNRAPVTNDHELRSVIRRIREDFAKAGRVGTSVIIDAKESVPWEAVVHVVDLCKLEKIGRIEFDAPVDHRN